MTAHVVIVGGGISGLAAAHRLSERRPDVRVTIVEAGTRVGGLLGSERAQGYLIETGPDSILTEKPWAVALIERLGLAQQIIGTRASLRGAHVVAQGALQRIPEGFSLIGPTDAAALLRSPILSWRGKLRSLAEPLLPARPVYDESLERFVTRRFGRELLDRLAQPLASGIYGADPALLSLRATMPRFLDFERTHGSVTRGLRERALQSPEQAGAGARYGMFIALRDGMQALIDALEKRLAPHIQLGRRVVAIEASSGPGYRVLLDPQGALEADGIILAVPAHASAELLAPLDRSLAAQLAAIPYGSAATVTFAWPTAAIPRALDGFGFVVPRLERRPILACTWSSVKFSHRAPDDKTLLRVFFGDDSPAAWLDADDAALVRVALAELEALMGVRAEPELVRVRRYPKAMPWYVMGHRARVARIDGYMARHPGLELAGNAYDGVGIPDAVRRAERAADRMVETLQDRALRTGGAVGSHVG